MGGGLVEGGYGHRRVLQPELPVVTERGGWCGERSSVCETVVWVEGRGRECGWGGRDDGRGWGRDDGGKRQCGRGG